FHQVFYHLDAFLRLVFERAEPKEGVFADVSDDGRWLFLGAATGTSNNRLWVADLGDARKPKLDATPKVVAAEEDAIHAPLGVARGRVYLRTTWQAPNGRIVSAAVGDPDRSHWTTVIAETKDPIREALLVRDRLAVMRLV